MSATEDDRAPGLEPDRHCLGCDSDRVRALLALHAEGAPPGTPEHDYAYERDLVVVCGVCDAVRLETWRHDCFDFESSFDRHWYFPLAEDDAGGLRAAAGRCPDALNSECGCPVHGSLRDSLEGLPPRSLRAERTEGVRPGVEVVAGAEGPRFRWAPP